MKKSLSIAYIYIKLILQYYLFLLFLFINQGESIAYARSAHLSLTFSTPNPTIQPTSQSTGQPTLQSTPQSPSQPSVQATKQPVIQPTLQSTLRPTVQPTPHPSVESTKQPAVQPTMQSTPRPTPRPTLKPTPDPTVKPTPIARQVARQPQQDQPTRQPFPIDLPHVPSISVTSATPILTRSPETDAPPIIASPPDKAPVLSVLPLSDIQQDNTPLRLVLILSIVTPLFLITLWFLMKWQTNRK
jgi:hypothetical protein